MPLGIGEYPAEYNVKVHGPYNPATNYGKADPLSQAKIGEVGQWLSRRNFSPVAIGKAFSRSTHSYLQRWVQVKRPTAAPLLHILIGLAGIHYIGLYPELKYHRNTKYRW